MPDIIYMRERGSEKEQLHQFSRLLRHHIKDVMLIAKDDTKIALGQDLIDLLGKSVLYLSMIWDEDLDA